jgi:hypothetical protein
MQVLPATMISLLFSSLFLLGTATMSPGQRSAAREGGVCVCGFSPRDTCDAGGYLHRISDCYDTDTNGYCGYDDQVIGRCDRNWTRSRTVTRWRRKT